MMTDIYHRLFYHIYKSLSKHEKKADAILTALIVFSGIQCFNVMVLSLILSFFRF